MKTEIKLHQPAAEYHAFPALNKSSIDKLLQCPAAYKAMQTTPIEPTPAMRLGTVLHALVLEPETFATDFFVSTDGRTKAGKAEKEAAIAAGKTVCTLEDYNNAIEMADAYKRNEACRWLLGQPGDSEVSIYWQVEMEDGQPLDCKARIDKLVTLPNGHRLALDVKTSVTSDPRELPAHCARYGYHRQAAWYMAGLEAVGQPVDGFVFLFVEKSVPHLCTPLQLDEAAISLGMDECRRAMNTLRECESKNVWPCYTTGIITADLPAWYYKNQLAEAV